MFVHPWIRLEIGADRRSRIAAGRTGRTAVDGRRGAVAHRLAQRRCMGPGHIPYRRRRQRVDAEAAHFAHRESAGVSVDLDWEHDAHHDAFRVEVVDRREYRRLVLHPPTGKAAVEAFHHPFCASSCSRMFVVRPLRRFIGRRHRRCPGTGGEGPQIAFAVNADASRPVRVVSSGVTLERMPWSGTG